MTTPRLLSAALAAASLTTTAGAAASAPRLAPAAGTFTPGVAFTATQTTPVGVTSHSATAGAGCKVLSENLTGTTQTASIVCPATYTKTSATLTFTTTVGTITTKTKQEYTYSGTKATPDLSEPTIAGQGADDPLCTGTWPASITAVDADGRAIVGLPITLTSTPTGNGKATRSTATTGNNGTATFTSLKVTDAASITATSATNAAWNAGTGPASTLDAPICTLRITTDSHQAPAVVGYNDIGTWTGTVEAVRPIDELTMPAPGAKVSLINGASSSTSLWKTLHTVTSDPTGRYSVSTKVTDEMTLLLSASAAGLNPPSDPVHLDPWVLGDWFSDVSNPVWSAPHIWGKPSRLVVDVATYLDDAAPPEGAPGPTSDVPVEVVFTPTGGGTATIWTGKAKANGKAEIPGIILPGTGTIEARVPEGGHYWEYETTGDIEVGPTSVVTQTIPTATVTAGTSFSPTITVSPASPAVTVTVEYRPVAGGQWLTLGTITPGAAGTVPSPAVPGSWHVRTQVPAVGVKTLATTSGTVKLTTTAGTGAKAGAPTDLTLTPGASQLAAAWTAPTSTGSTPVGDWAVEYRTAATTSRAAGTWTTFNDGLSTTPSATITGLRPGTVYDVRVAAVNAAGAGTPSTTASARPIAVARNLTWTSSNLPIGFLSAANVELPRPVRGNGVWVVAGWPASPGAIPTLATSRDGISWTTNPGPALATASDPSSYSRVGALAFGGGKFFIGPAGWSTTVATSADGKNWTQRTLPYPTSINQARYAAGTWVAIGHSIVGGTPQDMAWTSRDGVKWTGRQLPAGTWPSIVYTESQWVALSEDGESVLTSPDAVTWTQHSTGVATGQTYPDVAYANGKLVATGCDFLCGQPGQDDILSSSDGITWTAQDSGVSNTLSSIATDGIEFRIVEYHYKSPKLLTSVDGITWVRSDLPVDGAFITYTDGRYAMMSWSATTPTRDMLAVGM